MDGTIMRDSFADYHPLFNFLYFIMVIGFSLALQHPLAQGISLFCAALYTATTEGRKGLRFLIGYGLPIVLLTTLLNPLFNHEGTTVLMYFRSGNPLTLESVLYGISSGIMLLTLLLWFRSVNRVMTTDKFLYLFGKRIPALSLVLCMTFRMIPRFKVQMTEVADAQRSIGRDVSSGTLWQRTGTAVRIISILITWALENAIETADSMKSRGYGLPGRTTFSVYRMEKRDKCLFVWLIFCGVTLVTGAVLKMFDVRYFPTIRYMTPGGAAIPFYVIYAALCLTPILMNAKEERKWNSLRSEM